MSTNVHHAPRTIGFGARRLIYIAIGLTALALVIVALVSSGNGTSSVANERSGAPDEAHVAAFVAGRAVMPAHPDEAATGAAIGAIADDNVPAGSGVRLGRTVPVEPNYLPK